MVVDKLRNWESQAQSHVKRLSLEPCEASFAGAFTTPCSSTLALSLSQSQSQLCHDLAILYHARSSLNQLH